jgi:hypothetical protein
MDPPELPASYRRRNRNCFHRRNRWDLRSGTFQPQHRSIGRGTGNEATGIVFPVIWLERPDLDHMAGLDREESLGASGHERQQILHTVRFRAENQDRDIPTAHAADT